MEVAASGIAVASIAIQLLESTNRIRNFLRSVENAPQDLQRVANFLDRLSTLLGEVQDLLDMQASIQDQLFPASGVIRTFLQSCKESLAPLQAKVDKYSKSPASNRLRRRQMDLRAALNAGDLRNLEMHLQQEINSLGAALSVNGLRIQ